MNSRESWFGNFVEWSGLSLEAVGDLSDVSGGLDGDKFRKTGKAFGPVSSIAKYSASDGVLTVEEAAATGAGLLGGAAAGYAAGGLTSLVLVSTPPGWAALGVAGASLLAGVVVGSWTEERYLADHATQTPLIDFNKLGGLLSSTRIPGNVPTLSELQTDSATRVRGAEASVRPDIPRTPEIVQAIELAKSHANSMKPSAKKFANDPGGDGLGPGARDGGNSFPSGRPDRDQQGGSSNSNSSGGTKPSPGGSATPTKTVNTPTGPKQVDPSSTYGSSNKKHYDQVSKGNVRSGLPVALDLDGDGIEVSFFTNAAFDLDGDGYRERTAWVAPDDALLVIDLNADGTRGAGDGKIDQTKEVVLAAWGAAGSTDLQALAEARDAAGNLIFDTNGDGQLTAADTSFAEFRVWQDKDQDGVVDQGAGDFHFWVPSHARAHPLKELV